MLSLLMASSLGCYLLVLKWRGPQASLVTYISWDEWIPFQPGWVWVYLIPYITGPIALGLVRRETFYWYVKRSLVLIGITLIIFILVPTQTAPRPHPSLENGPTASLYRMMTEIDEPPANAAPSLHVSLTFLLGLAMMRDFPRWWWLSTLAIILVWLSTLFTRQHHLLDVGTGILLAGFIVVVRPGSKYKIKVEEG